ncbi:MAG: polysaccharide biosynthesis/export family protein, partial [Methylobacter sp.]
MLVNKYAPSFRNIFVGIFLLSFSACTQIRSPDVGQHNLSPTTEFAIPDDVYRLKPGDRVSMIVVPKTELVNYRINVGDEINVLVQDREDLSIDYVVNPDGSIQLMQLEPMIVSGITMQELNRKVNLAYQKQG